jgi:hypothetical protein
MICKLLVIDDCILLWLHLPPELLANIRRTRGTLAVPDNIRRSPQRPSPTVIKDVLNDDDTTTRTIQSTTTSCSAFRVQC